MLDCILCGIILTTGLSAHTNVTPAVEHGGEYWRYDINQTRNPYGLLAVGYEVYPRKSLRIAIALRHESSIPVSDHGTNSVELTVTWKPFR